MNVLKLNFDFCSQTKNPNFHFYTSPELESIMRSIGCLNGELTDRATNEIPTFTEVRVEGNTGTNDVPENTDNNRNNRPTDRLPIRRQRVDDPVTRERQRQQQEESRNRAPNIGLYETNILYFTHKQSTPYRFIRN